MRQIVKISVQGPQQSAQHFADDLTDRLEELKMNCLAGTTPELKFMTTAADGRQTATIIYCTK